MGQLRANNKEVVHQQHGNVVVVNTCGFIDNAKEESIQTILSFADKKEKGEIDKLFVTCIQCLDNETLLHGVGDCWIIHFLGGSTNAWK
jgi:tRNA A37 methylthiotransferase MiaB